MTGILARLWMRPMAGALLAFAAIVLLSPARAEAGCDHATAYLAHFELLADTGAMTDLPAPSERPKPCNGPMCSKAPAIPPASAAGFTAIELWAILPTTLVIMPDAPSPLPLAVPRDVSDRHGPSIFHPPR